MEDDNFLGEMPEPTPQVWDIYVSERTSELNEPRLFDSNGGLGFSENAARARIAELRFQKIKMGVEEFEYLMRLRGFDNLPKDLDTNDWGWDGPIGEPDPNYIRKFKEDKPLQGGLIVPRVDPPVETVSLDELAETEQKWDDWLG